MEVSGKEYDGITNLIKNSGIILESLAQMTETPYVNGYSNIVVYETPSRGLLPHIK